MEWTVVTVLIALAGFVAAITKPLLTLNTTIIKLTTIVDTLKADLDELTRKNSDSHGRLWEHNKAQDTKLDDHETRMTLLEIKNPCL